MLMLRKRKQQELGLYEERIEKCRATATNPIIALGDILRNHIWPFLNDKTAVALCLVNSSSEAFYMKTRYPVKKLTNYSLPEYKTCQTYLKVTQWCYNLRLSEMDVWKMIRDQPMQNSGTKIQILHNLADMPLETINTFLTKTININGLTFFELANPQGEQLEQAMIQLRRIPSIKLARMNKLPISTLVQLLENNSSITRFFLDCCEVEHIKMSDMEVLLEHTHQLKLLNLDFVSTEGSHAELNVHYHHLRNVTKLILRNFVTDSILNCLLIELPHLQQLDVSHGYLTLEGVKHLIRAISDTTKPCLLSYLNLHDNNIVEGCESLLTEISVSKTLLSVIEVNANVQGVYKQNYLEAELKALNKNHSLRQVRLDGRVSNIQDMQKIELFVMAHSSFTEIVPTFDDGGSITKKVYNNCLEPYFRMNKYKQLQEKTFSSQK